MKLFYRTIGEGQPLIILHGLFGQSDNWNTLSKRFSENGFRVFTVDLRNHGLSPHSEVWDYKAMSEDVLELITDNNLQNVILMGHSMGGKVAIQFAVDHSNLLDKLIVVDMAPKQYPFPHQQILDALISVDFSKVKTRKEVEAILINQIPDTGTRQFLLKNLYWKENGELDWRFNLKVINKNYMNVGVATPADTYSGVPTLFISGGKSNYLTENDLPLILKIFPNSGLRTIEGAGHWVHAEKPAEFFDEVMKFIK